VSTVSTSLPLARELREICGAQHVVEDPAELGRLQVLGVVPAVMVEPATAQEVAAILHFAGERGLNIVPAGGFTQQQTGAVPPAIDVLLSTSRLTAIEHYDPGDLTVGVGAGWTVAQLAAKVAADGLLFACDPPLPERATIGGVLAAGINGPLRHGYGGLRDYCIGVRFVTGDGRKGKGGGQVVKNVAGYDLMKLLIGSWGTLAVITGASFKLFPAPRQTRTFIACFSTAAEALESRRRILRSPLDPACLELISPVAHKLLIPASPAGAGWSICVRAAGSDAVLARYRVELGSAIAHEMDGANESVFWQKVANFAPLASAQTNSLLISFAVTPQDVQPLLAILEEIAGKGFTLATVGRVGIGILLAALWPAAGHQPIASDFVTALSTLRSRLSKDSSMRILHCPAEARNAIAPLQTPTHLDSMRAIKRTLDPKDILNRGRFDF